MSVESPDSDEKAVDITVFILENETVTWSTVPVPEVFPDDSCDGDDFYATVEGRVTDGTLTRPDGAGDDPIVGETLACTDGNEEQHFRRYSYPLPEDCGGGRLELFENVTPLVDRQTRLDLLESVTDRVQDGLYAADAVGRIDYCNEAFAALLGATPSALVGTRLTTLVADSDSDTFTGALDSLQQQYGTESTVVDVALQRDDRTVPVELNLARRADGNGGTGGHVGVARDVTDCQERVRRHERCRRLVEGARYPLFSLDSEGCIEIANAATADLFGDDPEALRGRDVRDLFTAESIERGREAIRALLGAPEETQTASVTVSPATAPDREFEATIRADDCGEAASGGAAVSLRETTEERYRRREHTFRENLLTQVGEELAEPELQPLEQAVSDAPADSGARDAAARLRSFPATLATTRRIADSDSGRVAADLSAVVDDALSALDQPASATLTVDVPAVDVVTSPVFGVAVAQLVENALEHAGPAPTVEIAGATTDHGVELVISDDGPGLPPEERGVLTGDADSRVEAGTGMGLWLARWVVRDAGATLSCPSDGGGTTITIGLERATVAGPDETGATATTSPAATAPAPTPDDEIAVLYVDPDERALATLRDRLDAATAGVQLRVTTDPTRAVELLESVDCLVTEYLPEESWQPLVTAARETADVPVVLYTDADHSTLATGACSGIDTLVQKGREQPTVDLLLAKIRALTSDEGDTADTGTRPPRRDGDESTQPPAVTVRRPTGEEQSLSPDSAVALDEAERDSLTTIRENVGDQEAVDTTLRVVTDGETRFYRYRELPLGGVAGGVTLEFVQDVTTAVEGVERVRLLDTLLDRTNDGISVLDATGTITYHNAAFGELLDCEDMVGDHASEYMAEGELERGHRVIDRLLHSPTLESEMHDVEMVTATGEHVTVTDHFSTRVVDGEYRGLVSVVRHDNDPSPEAGQFDAYERLVQTAHDPMYVLSEDGHIEVLNEAMAAFIGHPREELVGCDVRGVFPMAKLRPGKDAIRRLLSGPMRWDTHDLVLADGDGTERHFEVTVGVMLEDGRFTCSVVPFRDVTTRDRQQRLLDFLATATRRLLGQVRTATAELASLAAQKQTKDELTTIERRCQHLHDVTTAAETLAETVEVGGTRTRQQLHSLLAACDETVSPPADVPAVSVVGRPELATGLSLLGRAMQTETPVSLGIDVRDEEVVVRLQGEVTLPESLSAVDMTAGDQRDGWLARWVLEESNATLRQTDDGLTITLRRAEKADGQVGEATTGRCD